MAKHFTDLFTWTLQGPGLIATYVACKNKTLHYNKPAWPFICAGILTKEFLNWPDVASYTHAISRHCPCSIARNKDIQKVDSSNRHHAMIHHQNANAMGLASALLRGFTPWTSAILKSALARFMASAFWWRITVTPKSLENRRKNQEVGLLYSLFQGTYI
jgi:hypothetical protein